jgi:metal-responsive CopG/Arc/MetJ family transcriptional regulator
MKTAISIPDSTFQAAEQLAKRLGISRSKLFATAVEAFLTSHENGSVTESLNRVYSEEESRLDPILAKMQAASVKGEPW